MYTLEEVRELVLKERNRCAAIADRHMNNIKVIAANQTTNISAAALHIAVDIRKGESNEQRQQTKTY
jgi:hypothetical protein